MKREKNLYLDEIDNVFKLVGCTDVEYNIFLFKLLGINNKRFLVLLNLFSPILFGLNFLFTVFYFIISFIQCVVSNPLKKRPYIPNNLSLYLFFTPLFYNRIKVAKLYEASKYWIVGPNINKKKYELYHKILIDYKSLLFVSDYIKILQKSFSTLFQFVTDYKCLYSIFKIWEFYEVQIAIEKISTNSDIYFANQSDRWAILFDSIPSKRKILIQHGLAPSDFEVPHKLNNIDVFYTISQITGEDACKNILNCEPEIRLMEPTIALTNFESSKLKILIISHIFHFDIEKKLIEFLQDKNIEVYLKKYPRCKNDSVYKNLLLKNKFIYIQDNIFPKVDFVVSYYSTLAFEYMNYNIPVYMYPNAEDFNISIIEQEIKKLYNIPPNLR